MISGELTNDPKAHHTIGSSRAMPCRLGEQITKSKRLQIHGLDDENKCSRVDEVLLTHLSHSHSNPTPNHKDLSSRGERRDWGALARVWRVFSSKNA